MTANEWDQFFDMVDAWFSGKLSDKKRFAYRLSPLNEHPYNHLMLASKHLASNGQVWIPTVAELLKSLELLGHGRMANKLCIKCETGINEREYRAQAGRCSDCYEVFESSVLHAHNFAAMEQLRRLDEGRLRLIAYHLDERAVEPTAENIGKLLCVGEWKSQMLAKAFSEAKTTQEVESE